MFQVELHLCAYLKELYEAAEDENEHSQTKRKTFGATCVRRVNNTWYATDACFRNRRFVPEIIHAASIYKNQIEAFLGV